MISKFYQNAGLMLVLLCSFQNISGQVYTDEELLQGYAVEDNVCVFLFDESLYSVEARNVSVTGEFRSWSTDMTDTLWQLENTDGVWKLRTRLEDKDLIVGDMRFKFMINEGQWMDPPVNASNRRNNDLVYMMDKDPLRLKAEIRNSKLIWAELNPSRRSLDKDDYRLTNAQGEEIGIEYLLPNGGASFIVVPRHELDMRRVYFLEVPSLGLRQHCSFDGWFRELCSGKVLGANIEGNSTIFRLFAPRATRVRLYLYQDRKSDKAYETHDLTVDGQGVWEITLPGNRHGIYYDYTVHGFDEPGNMFFDTHHVHVRDPYARVSDDTWGRSRVWEATEPARPLENGIPPLEDVIAYEVHVQDFTEGLPVDDSLKGSFKAMTIEGLKNSRGEAIGFDHLLKLGINVLHLMPVQEYLHFPDDDWVASFKDDPYMISQGVNEENYQWGYRTSFAMAVESRYRMKDKSPGEEREEFRDLVQHFHDHGIAVIIDIVPNHTAENMDGNNWIFNFNGIDKQYYYRTSDFEHIGAYGNEVKTENRPMVQRWIIDQCLHFIHEFGVDGFRIDLAGQIDKQTLKALKEAIGDDKIVYGEPWIASNDPDFENNPDWDWYKEDAPICFFQDEARNAFKGPVFELNDKMKDRGWTGGDYSQRSKVMKGLSAGFPEDKTPVSGINYLDIHDNFALADQFAQANFDGRDAVDQSLYKIAAVLLYTSLGPIVTHGGSEFMRSKAGAPLKEVHKKTKAGFDVYMHGYRDTYNHRLANRFDWEKLGLPPGPGKPNDYRNMVAYWTGLNSLRRSEYGKVFRISETPEEGYYTWFLPENESALGYLVGGRILVLINAGKERLEFDSLKLPEGYWIPVANIEEIQLSGLEHRGLDVLVSDGQALMDYTVGPEEVFIWVLKKEKD